jgi:hypothetical protein
VEPGIKFLIGGFIGAFMPNGFENSSPQAIFFLDFHFEKWDFHFGFSL